MIAKYVRVIENQEIYEKTGKTWSINDVPQTWRAKVKSQVISDGFIFDDDGTAININ